MRRASSRRRRRPPDGVPDVSYTVLGAGGRGSGRVIHGSGRGGQGFRTCHTRFWARGGRGSGRVIHGSGRGGQGLGWCHTRFWARGAGARVVSYTVLGAGGRGSGGVIHGSGRGGRGSGGVIHSSVRGGHSGGVVRREENEAHDGRRLGVVGDEFAETQGAQIDRCLAAEQEPLGGTPSLGQDVPAAVQLHRSLDWSTQTVDASCSPLHACKGEAADLKLCSNSDEDCLIGFRAAALVAQY